uniref:Uncharacterized protein n=1 Tax=Aegilops tauschii TaxID=37682 RepID=N1R324_AEGTA
MVKLVAIRGASMLLLGMLVLRSMMCFSLNFEVFNLHEAQPPFGNLFEKMLQGGAGRGAPRDGAAGGGGRDRISDLTDDLCHHVFSYMKAWEVVRTSALSRRWRRTWASAPCLDIRRLCACSRCVDQDWYAEFVKHLLLRRDRKPLNTLRLHWNHDDANTWIVHALRRNATAIQLSAKHHRPILKLDCTVFLSGNLNILQLANVSLDSRSLSGLCSRCTSLEELELRKALIYATQIRSTSLKRLTMVNCKIFNDLTVDASNLAALRCIRPCSFVPQIKNSGSLVTATIMLDDACLQHARPWSVQDDEDDGDTYTDAEDSDVSESQSPSDDDSCAVADEHARDCEHPGSGDIVVYGGKRIFHSLSNVRTMNLSAHRGEVLLTTELENCPVFENLRTLSLGEWCIDSEFNALSTMLENSPNLENLFIRLDKVLSFLGNDSNVHENMMLPKLDTFVLLTNEGPGLEKDEHWSKNKHGVDGMRKGNKNGVTSDDFKTLKPP